VEYQFKLIGIVNKLKKSYVVEYKEAFDKAGKNEDLRYSEKEKTKAAESATAETKYKMDSVSSQIDYFRETIKTLDNMIFGVKHRIEIENFKIGMK
jgi:histidinol dehydrogenase